MYIKKHKKHLKKLKEDIALIENTIAKKSQLVKKSMKKCNSKLIKAHKTLQILTNPENLKISTLISEAGQVIKIIK